jgi:hypothetical protein
MALCVQMHPPYLCWQLPVNDALVKLAVSAVVSVISIPHATTTTTIIIIISCRRRRRSQPAALPLASCCSCCCSCCCCCCRRRGCCARQLVAAPVGVGWAIRRQRVTLAVVQRRPELLLLLMVHGQVVQAVGARGGSSSCGRQRLVCRAVSCRLGVAQQQVLSLLLLLLPGGALHHFRQHRALGMVLLSLLVWLQEHCSTGALTQVWVLCRPWVLLKHAGLVCAPSASQQQWLG